MTNPVPKTDAVFLKHFVQLITFLVCLCIGLILLGAYIYSRHPAPENPAKARATDQRLTLAVTGPVSHTGAAQRSRA